jgi:flagellar biogenesis protein FliO
MARVGIARRGLLVAFALIVIAVQQQHVTAKKDLPGTGSEQPAAAYRPAKGNAEPIIEEVTAKQLERVLNEKDYVAVFWCK